MLRDQTDDTMDMKLLENMQMDALNMETVHAYRNRHTAYRGGVPDIYAVWVS